jgi:hemolysin III
LSYQKINSHILPTYSKGEEIFNTASHLVGSLIGVATIILTILFHHDSYGLVSGIIFGGSLIFLYGMSSLYHGLSPKKAIAKKVFQIIDHCSIFVLIAGSYTPLSLCILRKYNPSLGWTFFIAIWAIAILGITLNIIDLKKYRLFSMICYLAMGWSIVFRADVLIKLLGNTGIFLIIAGGLAYSIGFVFYALGKHHKWLHSIFHMLCIVGSVLHCICILKYAI